MNWPLVIYLQTIKLCANLFRKLHSHEMVGHAARTEAGVTVNREIARATYLTLSHT